jgi:hypothetical protein
MENPWGAIHLRSENDGMPEARVKQRGAQERKKIEFTTFE